MRLPEIISDSPLLVYEMEIGGEKLYALGFAGNDLSMILNEITLFNFHIYT